MALSIRRVVTGHDAHGRAIVKIDEVCSNIISKRPNHQSCVVWTTDSAPADNSGDGDAAQRAVATTLAGGSIFRVIAYSPGVTPRMHRTDSIDYAVVLSGEIDMELDDGVEVHLAAGDMLVQRGTVHNWVNRGTVPCVMVFTLIDAKPVEVGGKVLKATG
jgi:quercetin dioxygenase-like cupin family protein